MFVQNGSRGASLRLFRRRSTFAEKVGLSTLAVASILAGISAISSWGDRAAERAVLPWDQSERSR